MENPKPRVRFAPSPTGPLHIGGVRTALFNYFFARKHKGDFILRIEDTDQTRFVPGAESYINDALKWCGIQIDEGVNEGGKFGPYRQSERKAIYKEYALKLVDSGDAYYAFDSADELDAIRKEAELKGETFTYNSETRGGLNNSLSLSDDEVRSKLNANEKYVIRFKMPVDVEISEEDMVRGKVSFQSRVLDDKIIFKSDGMPTYHLANVVDDHLMQISHVIRGEEWLPSLPLHVLLYDKFGWDRPTFAHLPLILKPVGKGKLSKRDGDKMGFPVFPLSWKDPISGELSPGYREEGYLPDAFVNMMALLGWNPGTDQELFSMDELIQQFDISRVSKGGARFDPDKTRWFNHQYIQLKTDEFIAEKFLELLEKKQVEADFQYLVKVCGMLKERANFVSDIWEQGYYFFKAPETYDPKTVKKHWKDNVPGIMQQIHDHLNAYQGEWKAETVKPYFSEFVNEKQWGFGLIMNAFRLCIVGAPMGADLFDICEMIGKQRTLERILAGIEKIGK